MKTITARKIPPDVARAVRKKAKREQLSLNKAVVRLLEEATGVSRNHALVTHDDLDGFFGTWSHEEARAFDAVLREQREIDPEMWK